MVLDATYKSKQNKTKGKGLEILKPKQMLQRLLIALAQVKTGNNSKSLLNEIRQIVHHSKQITKKVYSNIINLFNNVNIKMDTIFMNSENSKTSKPHVLILKLTDKLDIRIAEKVIA